MNRIETLLSFIGQRPDDPFPRYGLALEYKNTGQLEEAQDVFSELIDKFPEYTAAYLHAGNVLASLGRMDEARGVYKKGIVVAKSKNDSHSQGELEDALLGLGDKD